MDESAFDRIEQTSRSRVPDAVLDSVAQIALQERNYQMLFGARIMQVRHRLNLPLVDTEPVMALTDEQRRVYEEAFKGAAREAGELFLAAGDIPGAWQYFKAISDAAPVAAVIDRININQINTEENIDRVIQIAYQEGVSRSRGFELCLKRHGICTAITWFGSNPDPASRQHCLKLLVETLYESVAASLQETIAATENAAPIEKSIAELIANRPWLFEGNGSYVDSTHLTSVLRYAPELRDLRTLRMAAELADYGQQLNPMFHFRGDPPFEDTYRDHGAYLRALIGDDPDAQIAHFRGKIRAVGDSMPAKVLIELLVRLGRHQEAIEASLEYLPPDGASGNFALALQLCQMVGDYKKLRQLAREHGDLLAFAAGVIQS
jgi:hypothetical protein